MILDYFILGIIITLINSYNASTDWSGDTQPGRWNKDALDKINNMLNRKLNKNLAKNVILFLGDGMGVSTVTAGRIRKGQLKGKNGEEEITYMESLPHLALSKTYNIDAQTADSAGTATAYLSGVKTRIGVLGLDGEATGCHNSAKSKLESIVKWAHFAGKSTGIVTPTRITHATPAGCYAHVPDRDMEAFDGKNFKKEHQQQGCKDIAAQLIEDNSFINLIFAGGRRKFLRNTDEDYSNKKKFGDRVDNRNLIEEWTKNMQNKKLKHKFFWNISDFETIKSENYDHILGLMSYDNMDFETDRVERIPIKEPGLVEMTKTAIEILSRNPNGFFLLVEGGKIDHGHHISNAQRALNDYVVFDEAIGETLHMTRENETLIVVTADHSHVFTFGGYSNRGNPILGINLNRYSNLSDLNLTYSSINYANGPGGIRSVRAQNLTNEITENKDYVQEAAIYLKYETHGGEDVAIYASGPMSYLFDGTVEQSYVAHVMAYSACLIFGSSIGPYNETKFFNCRNRRGVLSNDSASKLKFNAVNFCSFMLVAGVMRFFSVN